MKKLLLLLFFFALYFVNALKAQVQNIVPNPSFEQLDSTSSTNSRYWKVGGNPNFCSVDSVIVWNGKYSMRLVKKTDEGYSAFVQEIPFKTNGLRKYIISGAIKVKDVKKYAGIFVKVIDKQGNIICRQDMGTLKINNTRDWKIYEAEFYSDQTSQKIRIAGLLYSSGEAWFDDFNIKEIPLSSQKLSSKIDKYINEYFKIVRTNSIIKDTDYITLLEKNTKLLCAGSSDIDNCHSILKNYTTNKLNDGHSFFLTPQEWKDWQNGNKTIQEGLANFASGRIIDGNIAYLNVPTFVSLDSILINKYVDSLQTIIAALDNKNPNGWIIDISKNIGGNSWAMIAGLGPLLGNGIIGYSISANGNKLTRVYNDGWVGWDTTLMFKNSNPYHLKYSNKPIAILYGNQTASAGEVVAISFRGKENTMSFGQETDGSTTRIDNFELSDKAYLNLASGVDADRNGKLFGGKIIPDRITKDNETSLAEAIKWIMEKSK